MANLISSIKFSKSFFLLNASLMFLLASCIGPKKFASGDEMLAREKSSPQFIHLLNDQIVSTKAIVNAGFSGKREVKTSEGNTYKWEEIKAFQTDRAYCAKHFQNSWTDKGWFVPRIIKGNINVYKDRDQSNMMGADGRNTYVTVYYIQKGVGTPLLKLTAGNLKPMVQDYEPAYSLISGLSNSSDNNKKLEEAILAYNAKP